MVDKKGIRFESRENTITKVEGGKYNDIPNLKTTISRREYRQFVDFNSHQYKANGDKSSIDYKAYNTSGFISSINFTDDKTFQGEYDQNLWINNSFLFNNKL